MFFNILIYNLSDFDTFDVDKVEWYLEIHIKHYECSRANAVQINFQLLAEIQALI